MILGMQPTYIHTTKSKYSCNHPSALLAFYFFSVHCIIPSFRRAKVVCREELKYIFHLLLFSCRFSALTKHLFPMKTTKFVCCGFYGIQNEFSGLCEIYSSFVHKHYTSGDYGLHFHQRLGTVFSVPFVCSIAPFCPC